MVRRWQLRTRIGLAVATDHRIEDNELKRTRNRLLKAEILDLREGLDAVEEKARADFGLIKEGETFLLLIDQ